jgi:protein SCO1/2
MRERLSRGWARIAALAVLAFAAMSGAAESASPRDPPPFATAAGAPDYRRALAISQAAIGRPVGDHRMRTSDGRTLSLRALRGKPLLVHLVYTGCFQSCPVATRFLARAVRDARAALGEDAFRVVSIGFNQPFDGPAEMAAFARQAGIDDRDWLFLSPEARDVAALTADLGFVFAPSPAGFDHLAQVTVVDAAGTVHTQVYGESFELQMLVGPLKELIAGEAATRVTLEDLWTKVKLYCTVYDPYSGRYRVNYSLFFELFAGLSFALAVAWWVLRERARA